MNVVKLSCPSVLFLILTIINSTVKVKGSREDCQPSPRCEDMGREIGSEEIEWPFRIRNFQPNSCGYPGFDLSCSSDNKTMIHLPNYPNILYVKEINYYDQYIEVKPSEYYYRSSEARKSLELLDLSKTRLSFSSVFSNFSLMNCSGNGYVKKIPILNSDCVYRRRRKTETRSIPSSRLLKESIFLVNCTKMYSYKFPADPESYEDSFYLSWSIPSCEICSQLYRGCRRKKASDAETETECFDSERSQRVKGTIKSILTAVSGVGLLLLLALAVEFLYAYSSDKNEKQHLQRIEKFLEDYTAFKPSRYSYADIKKITENFSVNLGHGAYGTVFKGKLSGDILVAVKILRIPNNSARNREDFINEVATMGRIHHVNVVRLVGYCADGYRRALIYEFLPNNSLDKYISHSQSSLTWDQFQGITLGIAKGIDYLHRGCDQRILHFDIKPHNILLDRNFTPKICDFGLAKLCSKDQSVVSMTATRGTMGYIAPEVFSRNFGNVSYKSDVYSFGMLLLEIVAGRKNTLSEDQEDSGAVEIYYPEWIYNLLEGGEDLRIQVDKEGDGEIAKRLAIVGLWCIQWNPMCRPSMKLVVQMLEGGGDMTMPPNPFASTSNFRPSKIKSRSTAFELEAIAE